MKIYQAIASKLQAIDNCAKSGNQEWHDKHREAIEQIMHTAPSGSGLDAGTGISYNSSTKDKLVFNTHFHHMNSAGYYTGWTEHHIIVEPSFHGIDIKVTGKNKNDIKEYIVDVFISWLNEEYQS